MALLLQIARDDLKSFTTGFVGVREFDPELICDGGDRGMGVIPLVSTSITGAGVRTVRPY